MTIQWAPRALVCSGYCNNVLQMGGGGVCAKEQMFISSQFWRLEVWDQGVIRADFSWSLSPWVAGGHLPESSTFLPSVCQRTPLYFWWYCLVLFCFGTQAWTQGLHLLSHSTSPFCVRYFQDRVSRTICPAWLQTAILLTSASQVARIIGMSYQHPAGTGV
jgi:hypothetical protein